MDNIQNSIKKSSFQIEMSVYCVSASKELEPYFNIFDINAENIENQIKAMKEENLTIYKLNLKENTPAIGFTNIIYYNNSNETLPLGMDVSKEIIIDKSLIELELKSKQKIGMVCYKEQDDELSEAVVKTVSIKEYDVK